MSNLNQKSDLRRERELFRQQITRRSQLIRDIPIDPELEIQVYDEEAADAIKTLRFILSTGAKEVHFPHASKEVVDRVRAQLSEDELERITFGG